ncbi:MAG: hypothetical protein ACR2PH_10040 [Desulfobulbia bacterium]
MITLEDCIAMCGLSIEEVDAIAEHEHIPEINAAALANYLLHEERGVHQIRDMIVDDIRNAVKNNNGKHAKELVDVLHHFLNNHPEANENI